MTSYRYAEMITPYGKLQFISKPGLYLKNESYSNNWMHLPKKWLFQLFGGVPNPFLGIFIGQ